MPLLRYRADRPGAYNGPGGVWPPGEVREVSAERAAWLLGLRDWFEDVTPATADSLPVPGLEWKQTRATPKQARKK